jgi:hypothetical protein
MAGIFYRQKSRPRFAKGIQMQRKCKVCDTPEIAAVVSKLFEDGATYASICSTAKVSLSKFYDHLRQCDKFTDEQRAARAAVKPRRARRTTDIDTSPTLHSTSRPTSPTAEAKWLFALCSAAGQSVETVRAGIPVSKGEAEFLAKLLDCAPLVDALEAYRQEVLDEFDKLVAEPPASLQEEIAADRERVRLTNLRNGKKREAVDAPVERPFKYRAAAERADWANV